MRVGRPQNIVQIQKNKCATREQKNNYTECSAQQNNNNI